jgi:serine/threonine protein kinase
MILCGFDTAVCLQAMCAWDPSKRPTASQALQHPFFQVGMCISPPVSQHELAQPKGYSSAGQFYILLSCICDNLYVSSPNLQLLYVFTSA